MTSRAEAQNGTATGGAIDSETDAQGASNGYVIPDAPALTILDATASKLERPGSARELGVSLANIVGKDGTIKAGLAVEITAAVFGLPDRWSYYQYRRDYWRRLLVRSGLSVGTAAGGGSDVMGAASDTRLGIGARIVLWDETDPLLDTNQGWASAALPLGAFAQLAMGGSYEYSFVVDEATAAGALKLRAGGERFRAAPIR